MARLSRPRHQWYKLLSREGVDITTISQIDKVFYEMARPVEKRNNDLFFTICRGKNFTHYIATDPEALGKLIYKKYFKSSAQILKYYREGSALAEEIKQETAAWKRALEKDRSVAKLSGAFKSFTKSFEKICGIYSIISWLGIEAWQGEFEELLAKKIRQKKLDSEAEAITVAAYRPWQKTAISRIQDDLAKGRSVKSLVLKYQFLRSWSVVWYRPLDEKTISGYRRGPRQKSAKKPYSRAKLFSLLEPDARERKFLELAPYIIFFKDWRDDVRRFHAFSWSFLFDAIALEMDIKRQDVGYFMMSEIESFLKTGKTDMAALKRRKEACVVTVGGKEGRAKILSEIPRKYRVIAERSEARDEGAEIRGLVANRGRAKGPVKIIHSRHDIKSVRPGDILVANTTHPDYLPAMQKAAAFITNEGGTISHAAIVARELNKPCIVGTKNATKILTDGQIVEIDADRGVILTKAA